MSLVSNENLTQGLALSAGFMAAILYVSFAWYGSDLTGKSVASGKRYKSLVFLLGPGGLTLIIAQYAPQSADAGLCFAMSMLAFVAIFLLILFTLGAACGFLSSEDLGQRALMGLRLGPKLMFEGWQAVDSELNRIQSQRTERKTDIHIQSKKTLAHFARYIQETLVRDTPTNGASASDFRVFFRAITGMALYSFFQHSAESHPDYCGCYFVLNQSNKTLTIAASVSGSENYATNEHRVLDANSFAYRAIKAGSPKVWPDDEKALRVKRRHLDVRSNIKRFIVVPVYHPNSPRDEAHCLGALCIDTAKDGWHFTDEFHRDILRLVANTTAVYHQRYLTFC